MHVTMSHFGNLADVQEQEVSGSSRPNRNLPQEEMQEGRSGDMNHTLIGLGSLVRSLS